MRLDRHWNELLQELRVTQGGVQILAGLLYTLPFQARFEVVDQMQRSELIEMSTVVTKLGLAFLAVSLTLAMALVFSVVAGWTAALVVTGIAVVFFTVVWWLLPLRWARGYPEQQGP